MYIVTGSMLQQKSDRTAADDEGLDFSDDDDDEICRHLPRMPAYQLMDAFPELCKAYSIGVVISCLYSRTQFLCTITD